MIPVASDRRTDWPSHPHATRDSLHEHDMWVAEGLTHRYPTKVLAELLSTCPQYCGHCTRMDLVGNSTPASTSSSSTLKPVDRYDARSPTSAHPGVRDVVVSGGDVANVPWSSLESFLMRLLDIDTIRDIRLATKALIGPAPALAAARRRRGHGAGSPAPPRRAGRQPGHPHPRQPRPVGDPAGRRGDPDRARGRRARRAQPGRAACAASTPTRPTCSTCASRCRARPASCRTTSTCAT